MRRVMSSHVYGPVPSRRLGRSLGVDLVPFKTCTYDCMYCQLGRTTKKTLKRREWVPLDEVTRELETKLVNRPDYITLGGSGEPTLFSRTEELICRIKGMTDVPVAIITNGSLLSMQEVRSELANADLIIPSLDAGIESTFLAVNRPHRKIDFESMFDGLVQLRREFQGQYWLEVFVLDGFTTNDTDVGALVRWVDFIRPDRVQLNTVSRPPADSRALAVSRRRMLELATLFDPPAEIITEFRGTADRPTNPAGVADIIELLRRRPCSIGDIADGLGMHRAEVIKYVDILVADGSIDSTTVSGRTYFHDTENTHATSF